MAGQKNVRAPTASLAVGRMSTDAITAPSGAILLPADTEITEEFVAQLIDRGIGHVNVHSDDLAVKPPTTDAAIAGTSEIPAVIPDVAPEGQPLLDAVQHHGCSPYDAEQHRQLVARFSAATVLIEGMVKKLLDGQPQDSSGLAATAVNYAGELARDGDHAVAVGEQLGQSIDISERSVRMATLGIGAGIRMGYDLVAAREIGICAFVHDWGWHYLPERLRDPEEPLSTGDWVQIMKHPAHTVECLKSLEGVSEEVRLAAFQVHEQVDGSGYPKGLEGERIHPYAKVINAVDQYMFLTSGYRGRPAIIPYDSLVYLLHQTKRGRFDSDSVRALVELLSLFPIGSYVRLSDNRQAKVLRQSGKEFTRPIVQLISPGSTESSADDPIIDLTESDVAIEQALQSPDSKEMRLDKALMEAVIWHGPDD